MSDIWQSLRTRQAIAVAAVTVITLAVVGAVLFTATSLGCGPANALGIKTISSKCAKPVAARTPAVPTPSPIPTATSVPSPLPSATPSPTPQLSPTPVPGTIPATGPATAAYPPFYPGSTGSDGKFNPDISLNCRLPVYVGPSGSGGFIVIPGGTFIADPTSAVTLPSPQPGQPSPAPPPQGGEGGPYYGSFSYDSAFSKWLPVPTTQVTPDGAHYAFAATSGIFVVNVASGVLSNIGGTAQWQIVGVQQAGVYAMQPGKAGLWLVPFSGDARQITGSGFWQAVSAGAAYGTLTSAVPQGVTNSIIRVDLQSGAVSTWFTRPDTLSAVMGVDAHGAVIVSVSYYSDTPANEVWLVPAAGKGVPILGSGNNGGIFVQSPPVADSHGVWFAVQVSQAYGPSTSGMALYVPNRGIYWMSALSAQLGGGCITA